MIKSGILFVPFIMISLSTNIAFGSVTTYDPDGNIVSQINTPDEIVRKSTENNMAYQRADGSKEYYGNASGDRVTREQFIQEGAERFEAMQQNVIAFAQNNQAAADSYGAKESKKIMQAQSGVTERVVAELERDKQAFIASRRADASKPIFQKALVSLETGKDGK